MPELHTFLLFAAASLLLLVVPGPAVLYVVTRGARGHRLRTARSERRLRRASGVVYLGLGAAALAEGRTERG